MAQSFPTRRLKPAERRRVKDSVHRLPYYKGRLDIVAGHGLHRQGIHAASFVPRRRIVVDRRLLARRRELRRILYHEIFHFVWTRLGNPLRRAYAGLLRREWREGARGELGWSSEMAKRAVTAGDLRGGSRRWRDYCCESFCDSAAWFCLGGRPDHEEWTLKPRFRERRRRWFTAADVLPRLQL
jgi:hypothetical protein